MKKCWVVTGSVAVVLLAVILFALVSKSIECRFQCQPVHENSAFVSSYPFGHLFVAVERTGNPSLEIEKQGVHAMIGYLAPNQTAQSLWFGSRNKSIDKHDYPSNLATVVVRKLVTKNEMVAVKRYLNEGSMTRYSRTWKWSFRKGDRENGGNCVEFVHFILRETGIDSQTKDENPDVYTPEGLLQLCASLHFEDHKESVLSDLAAPNADYDKRLELEKKNAWSQNRHLWDCLQRRKLLRCK